MSADDLDLELELEAALESDVRDSAEPECAERPTKIRRLGSTLASSELSTGGRATCPTLCELPRELLARVLAFLSAEDVVSAAVSCKLMNKLCSNQQVWQRLFLSRWNESKVEPGYGVFSGDWKHRYQEKDCEDAETTFAAAPRGLGLEDDYRKMAVSGRSLLPSDKAVADNTSNAPNSDRAVSDWRSMRGLKQAALSPPGSKHSCNGLQTFSRVGDQAFLCDTCGWLHVCDAGCTERVLQRGADLPTCPISGQCFDLVMNEWEEADEGFQGVEDRVEDAEANVPHGRLGKAWCAGYDCRSLDELRLVYGAHRCLM